jgi:hypothetical protein
MVPYVAIFNRQLIITLATKIIMPEKTTSGPGKGRLKLITFQRRTPEKPATAPKTALSHEYLRMCELRFFAAIAGTMTRKPTSNVPTIWMPIATTTETRKRYRRFTCNLCKTGNNISWF